MEVDRKNNNTIVIMLLIIMCMGVIIFCCYLIYRQNLSIKKEQESIQVCKNYNPNQIGKRNHVQILYGTEKSNIEKVTLDLDGRLCIFVQKKLCLEISESIYAYLDENDINSYIYVITTNGSITKITLDKNFNTKIEEKYHQLENIVRIYESEDDHIIFVDQNANEYEE